MQSYYIRVPGKNDWKYLAGFVVFMVCLLATTVNWSKFSGPW